MDRCPNRPRRCELSAAAWRMPRACLSTCPYSCLYTCQHTRPGRLVRPTARRGLHLSAGHNSKGHNYIGHNYIGHNYIVSWSGLQQGQALHLPHQASLTRNNGFIINIIEVCYIASKRNVLRGKKPPANVLSHQFFVSHYNLSCLAVQAILLLTPMIMI